MTNDPSLDAISAALLVALASVQGFGADRVHRGRYGVIPPATPWGSISAPGMQSEQGPTMGWYTRTLAYDVQVWGTASRSDLDTRVTEAEALLDAVVTALDNQRADRSSVLYVLPTWRVRGAVLDALADPVPTTALAIFLTVECSYKRRQGVSGVSP